MNRTCSQCRRRLDQYGYCRPCGEKRWSELEQAADRNRGRIPASREVIEAEVANMLRRAAGANTPDSDDLEQMAKRSSLDHHLARHEAGHVVVAWQLGLPATEARIDLADGGATRFDTTATPATWTTTHDGAVLVAGHLAEIRSCAGDAVGSDDDQTAAQRLVDRGGFDVGQAERIATTILDRHGADVARVADALLRHRRLTGGQLATILGERATAATTATVAGNRDRVPLARPGINNGQPTWRDNGRPAGWTEAYYQTWRAMHIAHDDDDHALFRQLQQQLIDMDKAARQAA